MHGRVYVNHRIGGYNERYIFTGKERDPETGYTYHGARYYDATLMTSWMAIDPMADKYPSMSTYNYCAWNPVKLVDPDGKDWYQKGDEYFWSDKVKNKKTTPQGCTYVGNDNDLLSYFGFSNQKRLHKSSKQWVQTLVGTNCESSNPYESKYHAFGSACAKAESTISFNLNKDKKTGRLLGISINATLSSEVSDFRAGGYTAASLRVSIGKRNLQSVFKTDKSRGFTPRDGNTYRFQEATLYIASGMLSEGCATDLQISGP